MHAKVTAYLGRIVIELQTLKAIPGEVIASLGTAERAIHIVKNTARNLGVSEEALALLRRVRRSRDSAGELDWSRDAQGITSFGWLGGDCLIANPDLIIGSHKFSVRQCVVIPNDVPAGARRQLDKYARLPALAHGVLTGQEL